jgi:protein O-GlcNAc transferase
MGVCLSRMGEFAPAVDHFRRAVELGKFDAFTLLLLGEALRNLGRLDEAVEPLRRSVALADDTTARLALAQTYVLARRYSEAVSECRAILDPVRTRRVPVPPAQEGHVLACLGMSLERMGRAEEAVACYQRAAKLDPGNHFTASGLAGAMNYAAGSGGAAIREAHEAYGRIVERAMGAGGRVLHGFAPGAALAPGEPLRLGIISPDFRRHAVACFLLPLVEHLDRSRIELYLYAASASDDDITARFRAGARAFRSLVKLDGMAAAKMIAADRVHVLIECAGHTMNTRMPILALRPAPVQALYLGYPATTGMRSVDWRIVDSVTDPPGAEAFSVERLWRLDPCHIVFRPLVDVPEVDPAPPSQRAGGAPLTFGSFSTVSKMTGDVATAWARVVNAVPGSRLLLKHENMGDAGTRADLLARFGAAGLAPDRVVIEGPEPGTAGGLLKHYARVDIALDTFPYSGTTTVCEALTMGVPVVARPGETTASRGSLPILRAVGLEDLAAPRTEDFIAVAMRLAGDPARLALRRELPRLMRESAVGDYAGFARRFEAGVRGMWADWAARPR